MIVIELEEKKYGKTMEALSMIKLATECISDVFEEYAEGRGAMGYRGGSGMSQRSDMGYKKHEEDYFKKEYPEYSERMGYRGGYGQRYM